MLGLQKLRWASLPKLLPTVKSTSQSLRSEPLANRETISASEVRRSILEGDISAAPVFRSVRIAGELNLDGLDLKVPLRFIDCEFDSRLKIRSTKCPFVDLSGSLMRGIDADDCRLEGSLRCDLGFVGEGACSFRGASIGGSVHFTSAKCFGSPIGLLEKQAVDLSESTVSGSIFMNLGFSADGQVRLRGARVGTNLDCGGGLFSYPGKDAIVCDGAKIDGSVLLCDSFKCIGKVNFRGAQVGQAFRCDGSTVSNAVETTDALCKAVDDCLDLASAVIGQAVSLQRTTFLGGLRLTGTRIGGDLNLSGANIRGLDPSHEHIVDGGRRDYAIAARRAKIGGTVFLAQKFVSRGCLDFSDARISGSFRCIGAQLAMFGTSTSNNRHRNMALSLSDARVEVALVIRQPFKDRSDEFGTTSFVGDLDFGNLRVTSFIDDERAWPTGGNIELDGFTYTYINEVSSSRRGDYKIRLRWLRRQPAKHLGSEFRQQPWQQLTHTLRHMGDTLGARRTSIARHNAILSSGTLRPLEFLWSLFLRITVGYGYRPLIAVLWSIAFVLIGWYAAEVAKNCGGFAPSAPVVQVARMEKGSAWVPPDYPGFSSAWYAVDTFVPLLELGLEENWRPAKKLDAFDFRPSAGAQTADKPYGGVWAWMNCVYLDYVHAFSSAEIRSAIAGGWFPTAVRLYKILGWVMLTLCVAAFSGLLKDERID